MDNVSIFYYIGFSFFFTVFRQLIGPGWVFEEVIRVDHLCIDESFGKVAVDLAACLQGTFSRTYGPCTYLILSYRIKMSQLKFLVPCPDDVIDLGWALFIRLLLKFYGVRDHPSRVLAIEGDCGLKSCSVGDVISKIVLFTEVDEVDHWLGSQEQVFVEKLCLTVAPS